MVNVRMRQDQRIDGRGVEGEIQIPVIRFCASSLE